MVTCHDVNPKLKLYKVKTVVIWTNLRSQSFQVKRRCLSGYPSPSLSPASGDPPSLTERLGLSKGGALLAGDKKRGEEGDAMEEEGWRRRTPEV